LELTDFPASEEADQTALSIPIHPSMADEDVVWAGQVLREELSVKPEIV
jgi:dTDP-4-amino-4,6-dideoxygalactose transaminase